MGRGNAAFENSQHGDLGHHIQIIVESRHPETEQFVWSGTLAEACGS